MRKLLDGMRSFWNSVEAVDVVARVFPMCCIRLSLLNIHHSSSDPTDHSTVRQLRSRHPFFLTDMANSFSKNAFDAKAIPQQDKCVCQRDADKCRLQEVDKNSTRTVGTTEELQNCACDAHTHTDGSRAKGKKSIWQ